MKGWMWLLAGLLIMQGADALAEESSGGEATADSVADQSSEAQTQPNPLTFQCVGSLDRIQTIALEPTGRRATLMVWSPLLVANQENRARLCQQVATSLTEFVIREKGSLKLISLTYGQVQDQVILCVVSGRETGCNASNYLFTIPQEWQPQPKEFLSMLLGMDLDLLGHPLQDAERKGFASLQAWSQLKLPPLDTPEASSLLREETLDQRNSLPEMAKQVTVRVLTQDSSGSGVLLSRVGTVYTVITTADVVEPMDSQIVILTADGVNHKGQHLTTLSNEIHLSTLQFVSSLDYPVAKISQTRMPADAVIYAAGYPTWLLQNSTTLENTQTWGTTQYTITKGHLILQLDQALLGGYSLGYTNEVEAGMRGGPIFNDQGQLLGLNGRVKYPLQGIEAFRFMDRTLPSPRLFQQMDPLSWGIPIHLFFNQYPQPTAS